MQKRLISHEYSSSDYGRNLSISSFFIRIFFSIQKHFKMPSPRVSVAIHFFFFADLYSYAMLFSARHVPRSPSNIRA